MIARYFTAGLALTRATPGSSGFDLRATIGVERQIPPGGRWKFGTGIYLELPLGWEGQVRGRSGLAMHHGIVSPTGTIDSDYRGEIGAILINLSHTPYTVLPGDRIAQLVIAPVMCAWGVDARTLILTEARFDTAEDIEEFIRVDSLDDLSPTERGTGGFGSTGR